MENCLLAMALVAMRAATGVMVDFVVEVKKGRMYRLQWICSLKSYIRVLCGDGLQEWYGGAEG